MACFLWLEDPARLEFETYKFNLAWTKMKQAEEEKSEELPKLRKEAWEESER